MHKVLIIFYHLTIMKILIIKKIHIRHTIKYWTRKSRVYLFLTEGVYLHTDNVNINSICMLLSWNDEPRALIPSDITAGSKFQLYRVVEIYYSYSPAPLSVEGNFQQISPDHVSESLLVL